MNCFRMQIILKSSLILLLLFSSCSFHPEVPAIIKKNFTLRYDGQNHGIDTLININGYYTIPEKSTKFKETGHFPPNYTQVPDTFYMNYVFFNDGIFLWNMVVIDCPRPYCMSGKLKELAEDTTGKINNRLMGYWGLYTIHGDTIQTQFLHRKSSLNDDWICWEDNFKIIDKNTILQINAKPLHYMSESDWVNEELYKKERKYVPAVFVPVELLPIPDPWLKKEKWFWKDFR